MKKIRIVGNGFVSQHLSYPIIPTYENIPLKVESNSYFIDKMLDEHKPDVLINCIGKTGTPNVDWCESNKEITSEVNTALPILLAEACAKKSIHLIHIGSGCIFFGKSPNTTYFSGNAVAGGMEDAFARRSHEIEMGWKETDFANPKSFYSKTKYAADLVLGEMKNVTVLRIRMPISDKNHPRNLLNKIRKYNQLIDIPNSVTFMRDLVRCIDWAAEFSKTGIYHVTNPQPLSAAQIMREYQKYESDHKFKIISEEELDKLTIAKRSNCILDTRKLYSAGFLMMPSSDALTVCMKQYIKNIWSSNV